MAIGSFSKRLEVITQYLYAAYLVLVYGILVTSSGSSPIRISELTFSYCVMPMNKPFMRSYDEIFHMIKPGDAVRLTAPHGEWIYVILELSSRITDGWFRWSAKVCTLSSSTDPASIGNIVIIHDYTLGAHYDWDVL